MNNIINNMDVYSLKKAIMINNNLSIRDELVCDILLENYTPGTFLISERGMQPPFINEEERALGLVNWLKKVVSDDLLDINNYLGNYSINDEFKMRAIENSIVLLLTQPLEGGEILAEMIWNQEYSDVIRRLEMLVITGEPDYPIDIYSSFNKFAKKVSVAIIKKFEERKISLKRWLSLSIVSGIVGLNKKSMIDATSKFYRKSEIPISLSLSVEENVKIVSDALSVIINRSQYINDSDLFIELIGKNENKIVVFTDDYIETIFLLKFYEQLFELNSENVVVFIPKAMKCGNDATYDDIINMINLPIFNKLNKLRLQGKVKILKNGPKIGGLNLLKVDKSIIYEVINSNVLDIRGCRAFEMAQGIKKDVFFSFNVIREISESITGLDGESQHFIFIHQRKGERCFSGFRKRHKKTLASPSGRKYMVTPFTVHDYHNHKLENSL